MKTLVCWSTIKSAQRNGVTPDVLFKRLAIYFEHVVFEPQFTPIGLALAGNKPEFRDCAEFISVLTSKDLESAKKLYKNRNYRKIFLNCWDFVDDVSVFQEQVQTAISHETMNDIFMYAHKQEMSEGEFIHNDRFKQLCGDMWHELQVYTAFKGYEPSIAGNLSNDLGRLFSSYSDSEGFTVSELSNNSLHIPDFGSFSWEQIMELRKDRNISRFRSKIASIYGQSPSHGVNELDGNTVKGLWNIAEYAKPKLWQTVLTAIVTNLPLPLPVAGVISSLHDGSNKIDITHSHGWVFFIQSARAMMDKNAP
ncbi:TPA: hypothetical protein AB5B17_003700 [Vibrio mimicus]